MPSSCRTICCRSTPRRSRRTLEEAARIGTLVPRTRSSHTPCRKLDSELRVQRGTRIIELLVSLGFRSSHESIPRGCTNFGIGTLVPRTRSSHTPCRKLDSELRVQRGTRIIELLVSLGF